MIFALSSLVLEHAMITSQSLFLLATKFLANFFADFMTVLPAFPADFANACFASAFAQAPRAGSGAPGSH
jgi:hypothetical protein